jgi:two-component system nitrate/nitrite response regulator NarL
MHASDQNPALIWLRLSPKNAIAQQILAMRAHFATQPFVAMSDLPRDLEAMAVFSVGARGYCNTHAGVEVLLSIGKVVEEGGLWIGESIMQRLLSTSPTPSLASSTTPHHNPPFEKWSENLTEREREVAHTVMLGLSNLEVASKLGITERTVKAHLGAILQKLQLKNRFQLALFIRSHQ